MLNSGRDFVLKKATYEPPKSCYKGFFNVYRVLYSPFTEYPIYQRSQSDRTWKSIYTFTYHTPLSFLDKFYCRTEDV